MKAMILAGGLGSRLSEETIVRPKPMVEIGGHPILWHVMKIYSSFGINEFVICLGYKGYLIKEYFSQYLLHTSDVTIDLKNNQIDFHARRSEPWRVTLVETGAETETGGRIRRALPYVRDDEAFCLTYGDGVADIDIAKLVAFHRSHGKLATVTGVRPPGRFGSLQLQEFDRHRLHREATRGWRLDQWRVFCRQSPGCGFDWRRFHRLGTGAAGTTGKARRNARLSSRRVLATHGHVAGAEPARKSLERG